MQGRDIICLSSHYWHEAWFRKQHFMSRLARTNRVLYVEPSYPMVRKRPQEVAQNRFLSATLAAESSTLWRLQPPRKLPKWTHPWMSRLNFRWFAWWVARAARMLNFRDPILWVYVHQYAGALDVIPHANLVFELVDDYVAYNAGRPKLQDYTLRCIRTLLASANVVITTTETLREKYGPMRPEMFVVPNGVDFDRFGKALHSSQVPKDIASLPRPVIGFIGVLFSFLDYERVRNTILKMPEASFVFVGRIEYEAGVRQLRDLPNAYILGGRPQSKIPAYINAFDVCISPFKKDEVSRHVSPLKVYEYLACGKPVVSTPMEALRLSLGADEDVIYWDDPDQSDFASQVRLALQEKSPILQQRRREVAKRFSWDALFQKVEAIMETNL